MKDPIKFKFSLKDSLKAIFGRVGILLVAAILLGILFPLNYIHHFYDSIDYSASDSLEQQAVFEKASAKSREIKLGFSFKADSLSKGGVLFNSASDDSGLRLILTPTADNFQLTLKVSAKKGLKDILIAKNIQPGVWHKLDLRISRFQRIKAVFDGKVLVNKPDFGLKAKISEIRIGRERDGAGRFDGEIRNLTLEYNVFSRHPFTWILVFLIFYALFFLIEKKALRSLALIAGLAGITFSAIFIAEKYFPLETSANFDGIDYDSLSQVPVKSAVKEFDQPQISSFSRQAQISFKFKIGDTKYYDNIFQTAYWNKGLRLEVGPNTHDLALIIGDQSSDRMKIYFLGKNLEPGKWYGARIVIDRQGKVLGFLDEKLALQENCQGLDYMIKDIRVGAGYDQNRRFNGEIKDFSISYKLWSKPDVVRVIIYLCLVFLLIFAYQKFNYMRFYLFIAAALFLLVLGLKYLEDNLPAKLIKQKISGANYDSRSQSGDKSPKEFFFKPYGYIDHFKASFKMKIHGVNDYVDVFQTDEENKGLRVEINPGSRKAAVIVGDKFGADVGVIDEPFELGRWYDLAISLDQDKRLEVFLDKRKVTDKILLMGQCQAGFVCVGNGYSRSRVFSGAIKDFNAQFQIKARPFLKGIIVSLWILFFGLIGLVVVKVLFSLLPQIFLSSRQIVAIIGLILIAGLGFALWYHYQQGVVLGKAYPFNTFLFDPFDRFADFIKPFNLAINRNPYFVTGGYEASYFPFMYAILIGLARFGSVHFMLYVYLWSFGLYFLIFNFLILNNFKIILRIFFAIVFTLCSYPFLFCLDRANLEILLFVFLSLFVIFYVRRARFLAILFLAFASAMKLYPIVFLAWYLADKRYKEAFGVLILTLAISWASLYLFQNNPLANLKGLLGGLEYNKMAYAIHDGGLRFNSSFYGLIKANLYQLYPQEFFGNLSNLFRFYGQYCFGALVVAAAMFFYVIKIAQEAWKKCAILTFMMLLLPYMSADYKLIHLFIPLWLFVNSGYRGKYTVVYTVFFGLLLIPKNYYNFSWDLSANISIMINPAIMILFVFLMISESLEEKTNGPRLERNNTGV